LGESCAACHANGPRIIRPGSNADLSPDLFRTRIATNDDMINYFNDQIMNMKVGVVGKKSSEKLQMVACASCHSDLTRQNAESIIALTDAKLDTDGFFKAGLGTGAPMPPKGRLTKWQIECLKDWAAGLNIDCD
jgi:hypothetical protein